MKKYVLIFDQILTEIFYMLYEITFDFIAKLKKRQLFSTDFCCNFSPEIWFVPELHQSSLPLGTPLYHGYILNKMKKERDCMLATSYGEKVLDGP